ncbi:MAG: alanine--tRNA ligase [Parcubacteria group bacterium]|nr:MAG: alanine--tRNA ligase [Parcubacteria group bacterium]
MKAQELKDKYLDFFASKNHKIISSASLIPENDPTVLFTTAGMHPLVPYLMGEKHPEGKRLANIQKCLRTGDIDEVGDAIHHTFFEMLGNWSLGDYFKSETISYSWELLTKIYGLDKKNLAISIFGGNQAVPEYDKESEKYWLDLHITPERISKVTDNWWGPAGQIGPCGPDTEIFYWTGSGIAPKKFDESDKSWVEIWNNVLMEFNKTADGIFIPLKQKNVDTGMGLERTLAVINGFDDNYLTELFQPIIERIADLSGKKYSNNKKAFRIIADHIRSAVFVLGDPMGIAPSNTGQGYVLRRLIRRAIRFGKALGLEHNFCTALAQVIINDQYYNHSYPEIKRNEDFILTELEKEEIKFRQTLKKGLREFQKKKSINGAEAFQLFSTYGFPLELTEELARENNFQINKNDFAAEFKKHQELSRTASAGLFKGGLADDSVMSKRHHTATHLLLQALRIVLGSHVEQRGANINTERIRFDFTHSEKMTAAQLKKVEDLINEQIEKRLPVGFKEMSVEDAKQRGAMGIFTQKYGEKVKVYTVGDFSQEICGGPHVDNTKELGHFKILKEESSSAGIRRIKAKLE